MMEDFSNRDRPATAVRVYTVCDESRYLIVRNVPSLGCGVELSNLFGSYGPVEDCKPMDAEECDRFTDVYWIKFQHVNNARFAKRKLDDFVFLGNKLQVSYAPQFESVSDTKEKLEGRRKEVIARIKSGGLEGPNPISHCPETSSQQKLAPNLCFAKQMSSKQRNYMDSTGTSHASNTSFSHVSSNQDYFPSSSMNATVWVVREKLDKISSSGEYPEVEPALKKKRIDNRRRI